MKSLAPLCLFLAVGNVSAQSTERLNLLVPAYFYPAGSPNLGYWNQLNQAASQVSVTAVINPNNGVFTTADPNYTAVVNNFRVAGGIGIGYVYTLGGSRNINDVKANITSYATVYNAGNPNNIRGIFIDEMPVNPDAAQVAYYRDLYQYVAANHPAWVGKVFGNPGANTSATQAFLENATRSVDHLVVSEMGFATYQQPTSAPAGWILGDSDRNRFAHLIHTTPQFDTAGIDQALQLALSRNAGYVYFTNDSFANSAENPWDSTPSYFDTLVARMAVTPVPEPGVLYGVVAACVAMAVGRKRNTPR
jgi:hypothetical protein